MKRLRRCLGMIVFVISLLLQPLPVLAAPRASIAEREIRVLLRSDGSADVSDQIVFAINGSVNNLVMEIKKPEHGGVHLGRVISQGYRGEVTLRPLENGQWDPTVFAGTYSLFDEPERLLIKAYYTFGDYRSRFMLQYRLPQAALRTRQVSRFVLTPVSADWPTGVGRLSLQIQLPAEVAPEEVDVLLSGVLIGKTEVLDSRTVRVDIPDTVPGEMPVVEVLFPSETLPDAPFSEGALSREDLRQAQRQAWEAALTPSLRAREQAAALAGQEAMRKIWLRRLDRLVATGTLVAALAGFLFWLHLLHGIRKPKAVPPSGNKLSLLVENPWMARMLCNGGRFDATAMLALYLQAVETGHLKIVRYASSGKEGVGFAGADGSSPKVSPMMGLLLAWHARMSEGTGKVFPGMAGGVSAAVVAQRQEDTRQVWLRMGQLARRELARSGFLTRIHERFRRRALKTGLLLFCSSLVLGVALAIWQPYVMMVPACLLVVRGVTGTGFNSHAVGMRRALGKLCRGMQNGKKDPVVEIVRIGTEAMPATREVYALPCGPALAAALFAEKAAVFGENAVSGREISLLRRQLRRLLPLIRDDVPTSFKTPIDGGYR